MNGNISTTSLISTIPKNVPTIVDILKESKDVITNFTEFWEKHNFKLFVYELKSENEFEINFGCYSKNFNEIFDQQQIFLITRDQKNNVFKSDELKDPENLKNLKLSIAFISSYLKLKREGLLQEKINGDELIEFEKKVLHQLSLFDGEIEQISCKHCGKKQFKKSFEEDQNKTQIFYSCNCCDGYLCEDCKKKM